MAKAKLQEVGAKALDMMRQSVWAAKKGANITVSEVAFDIQTLAKQNGFTFEQVEKEAQRISKEQK